MTDGVMTGAAGDDRLHRLASPSGTHVWSADLDPRPQDALLVHARPTPARAAHLTAEDRRRLAALPPDAGARLLARRALLRSAVAAVAGCSPADPVPVRRPGPRAVRLPDGRTWFVSVSSSGDRGLLAVSSAPVGVDLERVPAPPDALLVSAQLLHPHEHAWIAADDDASGPRFLATWVRKEAVVKCTGEGMSRDLRSFVVDARTSPAPVTDAQGTPLGMTTHEVLLGGHVAALAVAGPAAAGRGVGQAPR